MSVSNTRVKNESLPPYEENIPRDNVQGNFDKRNGDDRGEIEEVWNRSKPMTYSKSNVRETRSVFNHSHTDAIFQHAGHDLRDEQNELQNRGMFDNNDLKIRHGSNDIGRVENSTFTHNKNSNEIVDSLAEIVVQLAEKEASENSIRKSRKGQMNVKGRRTNTGAFCVSALRVEEEFKRSGENKNDTLTRDESCRRISQDDFIRDNINDEHNTAIADSNEMKDPLQANKKNQKNVRGRRTRLIREMIKSKGNQPEVGLALGNRRARMMMMKQLTVCNPMDEEEIGFGSVKQNNELQNAVIVKNSNEEDGQHTQHMIMNQKDKTGFFRSQVKLLNETSNRYGGCSSKASLEYPHMILPSEQDQFLEYEYSDSEESFDSDYSHEDEFDENIDKQIWNNIEKTVSGNADITFMSDESSINSSFSWSDDSNSTFNSDTESAFYNGEDDDAEETNYLQTRNANAQHMDNNDKDFWSRINKAQRRKSRAVTHEGQVPVRNPKGRRAQTYNDRLLKEGKHDVKESSTINLNSTVMKKYNAHPLFKLQEYKEKTEEVWNEMRTKNQFGVPEMTKALGESMTKVLEETVTKTAEECMKKTKGILIEFSAEGNSRTYRERSALEECLHKGLEETKMKAKEEEAKELREIEAKKIEGRERKIWDRKKKYYKVQQPKFAVDFDPIDGEKAEAEASNSTSIVKDDTEDKNARYKVLTATAESPQKMVRVLKDTEEASEGSAVCEEEAPTESSNRHVSKDTIVTDGTIPYSNSFLNDTLKEIMEDEEERKFSQIQVLSAARLVTSESPQVMPSLDTNIKSEVSDAPAFNEIGKQKESGRKCFNEGQNGVSALMAETPQTSLPFDYDSESEEGAVEWSAFDEKNGKATSNSIIPVFLASFFRS